MTKPKRTSHRSGGRAVNVSYADNDSDIDLEMMAVSLKRVTMMRVRVGQMSLMTCWIPCPNNQKLILSLNLRIQQISKQKKPIEPRVIEMMKMSSLIVVLVLTRLLR